MALQERCENRAEKRLVTGAVKAVENLDCVLICASGARSIAPPVLKTASARRAMLCAPLNEDIAEIWAAVASAARHRFRSRRWQCSGRRDARRYSAIVEMPDRGLIAI